MRPKADLSMRLAATFLVLLVAFGLVGCSDDDPQATPTHGVPAGGEGTPSGGSVLKLRTLEIPGVGPALVTSAGLTLYTFANDTADASACDAACAATWPPYVIVGAPVAGPGISGSLATITVAAGTQLTYNGKPLYRYATDAAPGQANGATIDPAWTVATP